MLVKWMVVVLNLLIFSFVIDVESTGTGNSPTTEDNTPDEYNRSLTMIDVPQSFPCLPETSEITKGEPIFKKIHPYLKKYSVSHSLTYALAYSETDNFSCGMYQSGILYGFSYLICSRGNRETQISKFKKIEENLIIYEFCYAGGVADQIILYTRHKILSPSLLKNADFASFEWEEISTEPYEEFDDVFVNMKERIRAAGLVPHMSVPLEDMAFAVWKKPLYHYSNIIGMTKEISSLWKFVDDRIRLAAIQSNSEFEVFMGEFTSEEGKFWVKLVLDEKNSKGVAVVIVQNLPQQPIVPPGYDPKDVLNDPEWNRPTFLKKTLQNSNEYMSRSTWDGYEKVKRKLILMRFSKIYNEYFVLFGLPNSYAEVALNFLNFNENPY